MDFDTVVKYLCGLVLAMSFAGAAYYMYTGDEVQGPLCVIMVYAAFGIVKTIHCSEKLNSRIDGIEKKHSELTP